MVIIAGQILKMNIDIEHNSAGLPRVTISHQFIILMTSNIICFR